MLFSVGGLFALYEAWHEFAEPEPIEAWKWVPILVLVIAIGLETFSFRTAIVESIAIILAIEMKSPLLGESATVEALLAHVVVQHERPRPSARVPPPQQVSPLRRLRR